MEKFLENLENAEKSLRRYRNKVSPKRRVRKINAEKRGTTFSGNKWRKSIGKIGK